jgi:hypothetical protein
MNNLTKEDKTHLEKLKGLLEINLGNLFFQIYCYGSRVKEQKQDSDFDIIIITFMNINRDQRKEVEDIIFDYGLENDILFHALFFTKDEFEWTYSELPLIKNVKLEGVLA